jgi:uncharacterized protein
MRSNSPLVLLALASCLVLSLPACSGPKKAVTDSPNPTLATASVKVGPAIVLAEIARTEVERERGLMFRRALDEGKGMLFVFDKDDMLAFWMKNTKVPLSIAYISSDGTIRQISDMEPYSLATVKSERSVRYALEVPRGWFERAGVKVGDRVGLGGVPALAGD